MRNGVTPRIEVRMPRHPPNSAQAVDDEHATVGEHNHVSGLQVVGIDSGNGEDVARPDGGYHAGSKGFYAKETVRSENLDRECMFSCRVIPSVLCHVVA